MDAPLAFGDPWSLLSRRSRPLPIVELRDMLGIARAVYRTARDRGASKGELDQLAKIGRKLQLAIELAASGPNTVGERAAWDHAEQACAQLCRMVEAFMPADEVVRAAARAVVGGGHPTKRKKTDER